MVALVVGLALGSGGGTGPASTCASAARAPQAEASGGDGECRGVRRRGGRSRRRPRPRAADDRAPPSQPTPGSATDGLALNAEGKDLIDAGDPAGAIPVLEDAVSALEGSGDELNYNYALFNLANALRLAGRPDEAIPLLEQRLEYPDQQDVVQAELDAALADRPGRSRARDRRECSPKRAQRAREH